MAHIYNKLKDIPSKFNLNEQHFKEFLKVISDCLLPSFNYNIFVPKFIKSVNTLFPKYFFSRLSFHQGLVFVFCRLCTNQH